MHDLKQLLIQRIHSGLARKTVTTCSRWSEMYRVMGKPFPGPWNFAHHPWLREMHDSTAVMNVGQKSAQMGFTETVLNVSFYKIDIEGESVLYVLPSKTGASDFSASRFDPALQASAHLRAMFNDVANVGHKRAGAANLFVRGSNSREGLKSVPAGTLVFDELEEMNQENIPLAYERASGQVSKLIWKISTPSIDDYGINKYFKLTTQEHFFFPCPACGRQIELTVDNLIVTGESEDDPKLRDSHMICVQCKNRLSNDRKDKSYYLSKGLWVPTHTDREDRGFYINQLYSTTITPYDLARSYVRSLTNAADEQEFFNSKMGLTHVVKGARVTDEDINACIGDYTTMHAPHNNRLITMGVDVGKWLHYEIRSWQVGQFVGTDVNTMARCQVLKAGKCLHFEELDILMNQYAVMMCVCDANPERRKAFEFAQRFWSRVKLCLYGKAIGGKTITVGKDVDGQIVADELITVDRTSWLDMTMGRYSRRTIALPKDVSTEYREHIKAPVRVYKKDDEGNQTASYVNAKDDHFAHAANYAEIALPLAATINESHTI